MKKLCSLLVVFLAAPVVGQTFPPAGFDTFPSTAEITVYADPACTIPIFAPALQGPVKIKRGEPSGVQPTRTIDTEIVSMSLTGSGMMLIEAPGGSDPNDPLDPPCALAGPAATGGPGCSPGEIQSQLSSSGDFPADSFFDVFVEVFLPGNQRLFNQIPIQMQAVITRIPPELTIYVPPFAACIPLHNVLDPFGPPVVFLGHALHQVQPKNHFKCYKAKDLKNPKFLKQTVSLDDQFGPQPSVLVKKLFLMCNPASKNGEPIEDPDEHLCCYKIKGTNVQEEVETTDQFGSLRLGVKVPKVLCTPCTKVEASLIP